MTNRELVAKTRSDMSRLGSFRAACLLGTAPASVEIGGYTFHDELEAEGYLAELSYALEELKEDECGGCLGKGTFAGRTCGFCQGTGFVEGSPFLNQAPVEGSDA